MIVSHCVIPVGCAVNVVDFDKYSYGERCLLAGYFPVRSRRKYLLKPQPYHLAARLLFGQALDGTHPETLVHFTFDEQLQFKQRVTEAYDLTKKHDTTGRAKQMRGPDFAVSDEWPGLQAADLYANQWQHVSVVEMNAAAAGRRPSFSKESSAVMDAVTHRGGRMAIVTAEGIEAIFERLGATEEHRRHLKSIKPPQ